MQEDLGRVALQYPWGRDGRRVVTHIAVLDGELGPQGGRRCRYHDFIIVMAKSALSKLQEGARGTELAPG